MERLRFRLWWSGNGDGVGGVRVMLWKELCGNVVEVRRVNDGVMVVVLFYREDVL